MLRFPPRSASPRGDKEPVRLPLPPPAVPSLAKVRGGNFGAAAALPPGVGGGAEKAGLHGNREGGGRRARNERHESSAPLGRKGGRSGFPLRFWIDISLFSDRFSLNKSPDPAIPYHTIPRLKPEQESQILVISQSGVVLLVFLFFLNPCKVERGKRVSSWVGYYM